MATTAPQVPAVRSKPTPCTRQPARRQAAALRELAAARPYGFVQAKLTVGPANDRFEQEADAVADRVMRMEQPSAASQPVSDAPSVSGLRTSPLSSPANPYVAMYTAQPDDPLESAWFCSGCSEPATVDRGTPDDDLQRSARGGDMAGGLEVGGHIESGVGLLQNGGEPLATSERGFFEPRFGTDFSGVRIHSDSHADRLARALGAEAFTIGSHIALRGGHDVGTTAGRRLLAHELTHVVQQSGGTGPRGGTVRRTIGDGHDLAAPRFSGNRILEAAFDDERLVRNGDRGEAVRLIQESLVAMGYALPISVSETDTTQLDGIFGPETEAAIRRFQTDAGAVLVDGIVGPETMGLLDRHDVSQPAARPPQITGPVAPPLAATDCDQHFNGIVFTLANQVASAVASPASIGFGVRNGLDLLIMRGRFPINYDPQITITAPSNAAASQFRVGFVQNLLTSDRFADYDAGGQVRTVVPVPIKDGAPADYHPIFVSGPHATTVEDFTASGDRRNLNWPDTPGSGATVNLLDACAGGGLVAQVIASMQMHDTFRLWTVVQHRPSGCVRALHHVDWQLDWEATVADNGGRLTVTTVLNRYLVTEPDGNGSPRFLQGGPVPGAIARRQCS
jgi:peptidoglycan hydrolase-like protein with peptidoglycan-binding domain